MPPVLIECIIKRAGGSVVALADATYTFKPLADDRNGAHVALVSENDAMTLLAIPEGYRLADDDAIAAETLSDSIAELRAAAERPAPLDEFASLSTGAIADQFTRACGFPPIKGSKREDLIAALRTFPTNPAPAATISAPAPAAPRRGGRTAKPKDEPAAPPTAEPVQEPVAEASASVLEQYRALFGAEPAEGMDEAAMIQAIADVPKE